MDVQPWGQPQHPHPAMRAAQTDRDRAVDVLKAAYAEDRLTAEEYSQRFDLASAAKTYGELAQLTADLPIGPLGGMVHSMPLNVPPTFYAAPPTAKPPVNKVAIASVALAAMCVPSWGTFGVPALITGYIASKQIKERGEGGQALARAGMVVGWMAVAGWLLIGVAAVLLGVR